MSKKSRQERGAGRGFAQRKKRRNLAEEPEEVVVEGTPVAEEVVVEEPVVGPELEIEKAAPSPVGRSWVFPIAIWGLALLVIVGLLACGLMVSRGLPAAPAAMVPTEQPAAPVAAAQPTATSAPAPSLAFVTASLPAGRVGEEYGAQLQVTNAVAEVVFYFSQVSANLPPGLMIQPDGLLAGMPSEAGDFSFVVVANDGTTATTQAFSLHIEPAAEVVEPEVPVKAEAPAEVVTGSISGTIVNAPEGMEVHLIGDGEFFITITDAEGNYEFEDVPVGIYNTDVAGLKTPTPVQVTEGAKQASTLGYVERGDTLWDMYGAHSWEEFTDFAETFGLKHFVNDRGTEDTADDLLVVIIQPGQVFDLAAMPAG